MKPHRRMAVTALAMAGAIGVAVLLRYPPSRYSFYPRCPVYVYLHLQCPGCGATRALAALLHGHLAEAFHSNALFVLMLPFLLSYAAVCGYRAWTMDEFRWPTVPAFALHSSLAAAVIFTLARNLAP